MIYGQGGGGLVAKSCPTLAILCSSDGGIFQERILEWVSFPSPVWANDSLKFKKKKKNVVYIRIRKTYV